MKKLPAIILDIEHHFKEVLNTDMGYTTLDKAEVMKFYYKAVSLALAEGYGAFQVDVKVGQEEAVLRDAMIAQVGGLTDDPTDHDHRPYQKMRSVSNYGALATEEGHGPRGPRDE